MVLKWVDITAGTLNRGVNVVGDAIDHSESKLSNSINTGEKAPKDHRQMMV